MCAKVRPDLKMIISSMEQKEVLPAKVVEVVDSTVATPVESEKKEVVSSFVKPKEVSKAEGLKDVLESYTEVFSSVDDVEFIYARVNKTVYDLIVEVCNDKRWGRGDTLSAFAYKVIKDNNSEVLASYKNNISKEKKKPDLGDFLKT